MNERFFAFMKNVIQIFGNAPVNFHNANNTKNDVSVWIIIIIIKFVFTLKALMLVFCFLWIYFLF